MPEPTKPLTAAQCLEKAAECREQASLAKNDAHRIMLDHMADTWARIAKDMKPENGHGG